MMLEKITTADNENQVYMQVSIAYLKVVFLWNLSKAEMT